jgi:hypothetical protein
MLELKRGMPPRAGELAVNTATMQPPDLGGLPYRSMSVRVCQCSRNPQLFPGSFARRKTAQGKTSRSAPF